MSGISTMIGGAGAFYSILHKYGNHEIMSDVKYKPNEDNNMRVVALMKMKNCHVSVPVFDEICAVHPTEKNMEKEAMDISAIYAENHLPELMAREKLFNEFMASDEYKKRLADLTNKFRKQLCFEELKANGHIKYVR